MVGYTEAITDPSYKEQILIQTYPLIGNYGVCPEQFESEGPKISGYVVRELCDSPSHWSSKMEVGEWLEAAGVPGIQGVDTRMLTKRIREMGTQLGILQVYDKGVAPDVVSLLEEAKRVYDPNKKDLVSAVATKEVRRYEAKEEKCILALIDCGVKMNIVRSLLRRGASVWQFPPGSSAKDVLRVKPDGLVISNGPGDPKMVGYVIEKVPEFIDAGVPIMGICLGCQIIALALGGDTYKLKFGHRGQNHPCVEVNTGRCYITSQNHGFAVRAESLKGKGLEVTYVNANDGTVEGIADEGRKIFAVQFHPEGAPGPEDTDFLFDRFIGIARGGRCRT